ncbi:MAG: histidinol-phosphate transaminase [Candidatus Omnitrophica bacterium CG1_02_49_16]|nr:MAG: histidinol-phosphate transaminase [Candidatus Omnitrophica bacterium CG1_02_49_16]
MSELFPSAKKNLSRVRSYLPGKPIEEVEREYGLKNAIKMASNENALGPSPKAVAALRANLFKIHRYPDGNCFYLRNKLSRLLHVPCESFIFGNGSDEILVFAVRALVGPRDEVIIAQPTFMIYEIATQVEDGLIVKVPMKNFHYDLAGMKARVNDRTKLIFIANPDNPVGTIISEKSLLRFLKEIPPRVAVVLDEAYYEFAKNVKGYPDSIKFLAAFKNVIISRTFSKAYGLSGLRIGFGITSPELAGAMNKVKEPFNVNSLAQTAAMAALDDKAHLRKTLQMVSAGRKMLSHELEALGLRVVDTATNFILTDLGRASSTVYEKLLRKGIIVRPMAAWGLGTFIRVTIGKPAENKRFITELKHIIC